MSEQWLPVPGYVGLYEVSDQGRVRSLPRWVEGWNRHYTGKVLTPTSTGGAVVVNLTPPLRRYFVHHLVLLAFVGPRPEGLEGCHWDGDHTNNTVGNLRWDTPLANAADMRRHGTHHHTRKTHCKRGHRLVPSNLRTNSLPRRDCRSCDAGRSAHRKYGVDIQTYADEFYARLKIAV